MRTHYINEPVLYLADTPISESSNYTFTWYFDGVLGGAGHKIYHAWHDVGIHKILLKTYNKLTDLSNTKNTTVNVILPLIRTLACSYTGGYNGYAYGSGEVNMQGGLYIAVDVDVLFEINVSASYCSGTATVYSFFYDEYKKLYDIDHNLNKWNIFLNPLWNGGSYQNNVPNLVDSNGWIYKLYQPFCVNGFIQRHPDQGDATRNPQLMNVMYTIDLNVGDSQIILESGAVISATSIKPTNYNNLVNHIGYSDRYVWCDNLRFFYYYLSIDNGAQWCDFYLVYDFTYLPFNMPISLNQINYLYIHYARYLGYGEGSTIKGEFTLGPEIHGFEGFVDSSFTTFNNTYSKHLINDPFEYTWGVRDVVERPYIILNQEFVNYLLSHKLDPINWKGLVIDIYVNTLPSTYHVTNSPLIQIDDFSTVYNNYYLPIRASEQLHTFNKLHLTQSNGNSNCVSVVIPSGAYANHPVVWYLWIKAPGMYTEIVPCGNNYVGANGTDHVWSDFNLLTNNLPFGMKGCSFVINRNIWEDSYAIFDLYLVYYNSSYSADVEFTTFNKYGQIWASPVVSFVETPQSNYMIHLHDLPIRLHYKVAASTTNTNPDVPIHIPINGNLRGHINIVINSDCTNYVIVSAIDNLDGTYSYDIDFTFSQYASYVYVSVIAKATDFTETTSSTTNYRTNIVIT